MFERGKIRSRSRVMQATFWKLFLLVRVPFKTLASPIDAREFLAERASGPIPECMNTV
jgi:hypothetical protein